MPTPKSTDWALRVFYELRRQRNASQPEKCPSDMLESLSSEPLNYWLSRFSVEARHADGDRYPSSTIYHLLAGLLRYATMVVTFKSFKNKHYVRCNLSHYVLQHNSLLQQPTSAVQSQRRVMQLDSSSFISSMFNGLSNCRVTVKHFSSAT